MEVITVESKAYKELMAKINPIAQFVAEYQSVNMINPEEEWIDSFKVCYFLNISQRTIRGYNNILKRLSFSSIFFNL
ncbi:hypothetical protein AQPE_4315 [Aquipluma nitroreducens]|uniref:Uncharacterized protein n=1 Tax=Aquipluma nitroreducens TaxID=2010828 RepID=A0A5K7SFZ0_9BACT|nr:hypothetical protein [Aquipluma nitroreducens]BBE20124.1 hypothetical protein AQPE_4315 [Aquipluma nitroreducens]